MQYFCSQLKPILKKKILKKKNKIKRETKVNKNEQTHSRTHLAKTYLGAAGCGYCVYASSGDAAVLACSESVIGIVGIIVGGA